MPRFQENLLRADPRFNTKEPAPAEVVPFANEPVTVNELLDQYVIEFKTSGRWPGTTLFLVPSAKRNGGSCGEIAQGQRFKLFLAVWLNRLVSILAHYVAIISSCMSEACHDEALTILDNDFMIAHGRASFLKPEKYNKLVRQNVAGHLTAAVDMLMPAAGAD